MMMNVKELVETVMQGGGILQLDGDRVRINAPKTVLTENVINLLRNNREEVIAILSAQEEPVNSSGYIDFKTIRLNDFAVARMVIPIFSEVIKEKVYFISDNAVLPLDKNDRFEGCVVYRASELRELVTACAETIRTIHEVKKLFGGKVV